ncbi:hypothetical protein EXE58_04445 [Nocardioides seonyuensis]|uniref:Prokaryotic glutathione synthetase ATP-binding domain-containing protein n=1 Tax=Nocardioides seonyuensis TaxID=2518371 RepID=A0A4P7ICG8_9ACTN|nr:hypothetical protein [Nocardioides seonyuensis]QBX54789.1 hypothetical protein EXE58_04445 [Nocardioides seonyuensis]
MTVLLATSGSWPEGEPGAAALGSALAERGVASRWAVWNDPDVDWDEAALVAVRSTWDYIGQVDDFVAWARSLDQRRLLNGAECFAWNVDKAYLLRDMGDVPVVPTVLAGTLEELREGVRRWDTAVVKPRVGAGGAGLLVVTDPQDPRLGTSFVDHPGLPVARGPWVVQPLVESIGTRGETSVFVLDGVAVSQVDKLPAAGEVRVHEHFGGASRPVALDPAAAELAEAAVLQAGTVVGRPLDYGRIDMVELDGRLVVSEVEATEPGLYLDVLPANAAPFAELVAARL